MAIGNSRESWGLIARLLHWVMAVAILFLLGVGFYMAEILTGNDSDTLMEKFDLIQTHKSWGFTVFVLACLRVIWRALNPTPALPKQMSKIEIGAAHAGHFALYLCMFAMPVSGWLMASASPLQDSYGIKNMVFGLFEMPDPFVPGNEALSDLFANVHFYTACALALILAGHAAAALKHQFVKKDGLLRRMILG